MSEENVELVERLFGAFNSGTHADELVSEFFDPEVAWVGADDALDRGPFRGREEVLAHIHSWMATLDAFRTEAEEIIDAGDKVVVAQRSHGILKGSSAEADVRFASVWEIRDGKVVSHNQYRHVAEALKAVGLE